MKFKSGLVESGMPLQEAGSPYYQRAREALVAVLKLVDEAEALAEKHPEAKADMDAVAGSALNRALDAKADLDGFVRVHRGKK